MRHWLFVTEYQWEVMCADDDNAMAISVIDVKGVSVFDLMGATLDFVRKTITYANLHYPGRAYKVYNQLHEHIHDNFWSFEKFHLCRNAGKD